MENYILNQGVSVTKYHEGHDVDALFIRLVKIGAVIFFLTLPIDYIIPSGTIFNWFNKLHETESLWSKIEFWAGFVVKFLLAILIFAGILTSLYEVFCSIFIPICVVKNYSYKIIYYKNYFLIELVFYDKNEINSRIIEIPFDQITQIRYNDESSTKRIKKIEIKLNEDFKSSKDLKWFDTSNLILSRNYQKKDIYKIVDALNKIVSKYKSSVDDSQNID